MPLSEDEELELLTLERNRGAPAATIARPKRDIAAEIANDPISRDALATSSPFLTAFNYVAGHNPVTNMASTLGTANDLLDKGANYAGGRAVDAAANAGASPRTAAIIGTGVNTGIQAIPMVLGGEAAKIVSPLMKAGAVDLMQRAVKPVLKEQMLGRAGPAIQTMLDEGISVSKGGVEKLRNKIDDLNTQVSDALSGSGATVDKGAVGSRIQDVVNRIERSNPTPQDALRDVSKVYDDFLNNGLVPRNIPVTQAQELKQGIYRVLREKYGVMGSDTVEAQKALARGFKEEVNSTVPGVRALNEQESKLLGALNINERRVMMEANHNPAGLSLLAKSPEALAAFLVDRSGLFKSLIARMMNAGATQIPANAARAGIGATTINQPQGER